MQTWQRFSQKTHGIGFLLFDNFSNHCLANAMEPLRAANTLLGRNAYDWHILTPGNIAVTSSSGLPVMPTAQLPDRPGGDALFVISSYGHRNLATAACARMLRAAARRYDTLVGLDTGSWLLAAAGLLDGRTATIHPDLLDSFAEHFPETACLRARFHEDGNRWSCGGAMAAFEIVLRMIGQTHGAALTLEIGAMFMHGGGDSLLPAAAPATRDRFVAAALGVMYENIETVLPLPEVARWAGCSQRQMEERFQRAFGTTPRQVYRRVRLNSARRLIVSESMPMAEIAHRCGYADASAFSRAFRQEFGIAPRDAR